MFEECDEIRKRVELLMQLADTYARGQVVPWSIIEAISGPRSFGRGKYIINRWRERMLTERDIRLWSARGIGLELLTESEQVVRCPNDRRQKMFRQSSKAMKELKHVNVDGLSDHGKRARALQIAQFTGERKVIRRGTKLFRHESNPRPVSA